MWLQESARLISLHQKCEVRGETDFQHELFLSVVLLELLFIKRFSDKEENWLSRTKTIWMIMYHQNWDNKCFLVCLEHTNTSWYIPSLLSLGFSCLPLSIASSYPSLPFIFPRLSSPSLRFISLLWCNLQTSISATIRPTAPSVWPVYAFSLPTPSLQDREVDLRLGITWSPSLLCTHRKLFMRLCCSPLSDERTASGPPAQGRAITLTDLTLFII